ncbi:MAG TPA: hypothetical protein VN048_05515 [Verrucomicrobiae bacterium]|jgi:hypothetical protein|nr:hypothetical protein [Verrucomicrobiae bacterium]
MLIDCMVYLAVFFVITGLALSIFYRCSDGSRLVGRTADDISSTVSAGERWRDDVRQATVPLRVEDFATGQLVTISTTNGAIRYRFSDGAVWRQNGDNAAWTSVLSRVKSSSVTPDNRHRVTAWRWEVELKPRQKFPRTLPLFTFEAVPMAGANP